MKHTALKTLKFHPRKPTDFPEIALMRQKRRSRSGRKKPPRSAGEPCACAFSRSTIPMPVFMPRAGAHNERNGHLGCRTIDMASCNKDFSRGFSLVCAKSSPQRLRECNCSDFGDDLHDFEAASDQSSKRYDTIHADDRQYSATVERVIGQGLLSLSG